MIEEMYETDHDVAMGIKHDTAYKNAMDVMFNGVFDDLDKLSVTDSKTVEETLEERGDRYGQFTTQALISQSMKNRVRGGKSWDSMDYDMKEAIDMILHKVARIVNGDPYYMDSWHDIIGYATLIEKRFSNDTQTI